MLSLKKLKVRGFRGFVSEREFRFDSPVVILFGENRHGKSSTLNAIEWCFFGGNCVGEKTGIRERVGWEIPNRHMANPDVLVEVELSGPGGTYIVQRGLKKGKGRGKTTGELKLTLPDGTNLTRAEAGERLTQLLRSSFRDFLTTVYQHQEVIRDIVTQQPKERNDAIDRLLGLSDYKNLLKGLDDADCEKSQKDADDEFKTFEARLESVRQVRNNDVKEARKEASDGGVDKKELNAKTALKLAADVLLSLADFASDAGIEPPDLEVPDEWNGLPALQKSIKKEITRMRSALPEQKEQNSLHRRQKTASDLKSDYEVALEARKNAKAKIRKLDKDHGSQEKLLAKIAGITKRIERKKQERMDANARVDLVKRAIEYLEEAGVEEPADRCPVCGKRVSNLLEHLREEWEEKLNRQVAAIQKKIDTLEQDLAAIEVVRMDYADLHQKLEEADQDLAESRDEIGEYLETELTDRDDPLAMLKKELRRIGSRLKKLQAALEVNRAEDDLAKVELVVRFLQAQDKKRTIDQIQESQEFEDLENIRDQMAQHVIKILLGTSQDSFIVLIHGLIELGPDAILEFLELVGAQPLRTEIARVEALGVGEEPVGRYAQLEAGENRRVAIDLTTLQSFLVLGQERKGLPGRCLDLDCIFFACLLGCVEVHTLNPALDYVRVAGHRKGDCQ